MMNRMLIERDRSMLSGVGLEQIFWVEAIVVDFYLVNRSPTSTLVDKTPITVWLRNKPSMKHLRVFGCKAYAHFPSEERSKLENKVAKCIFYWLWCQCKMVQALRSSDREGSLKYKCHF